LEVRLGKFGQRYGEVGLDYVRIREVQNLNRKEG